MTITTPTSRQEHAGNGVTTEFAVPFRFLANVDITVFLRTAAGVQVPWTEGTQYTLTGAGLPAGGSLTVITVPTDFTPLTLEQLVILRKVAKIQETDYVENDPFPAETHETALDRLTMISQELDEQLGRTFSIPETDTYAGGFELPGDVARALNFLAFDSLGGPIVAVGTGPTTTPVTAFMDTVLAAGTAGAARALLVAQEDVITTRGDLVVGDATPTAARLAIGTAGQRLESDGTDVLWVTPAVTVLPRSYLSGIETANNGADPTNDLDFTAGVRRSDDDTANLSLGAETRAIDAVFAEGGPGFRDSADNLTGAKTFHLYAIGGTGKTDDLFASTLLAPTLPTGFTYKRRFFSRRWTGTAWELGVQVGDRFDKLVPVSDVSATNPGTAAVTETLTVPTGIVVDAVISVSINNTAGGTSNWGLITSLDTTDTAPSGSVKNIGNSFNTATGIHHSSNEMTKRTNTSAQVRSRLSASTASVTLHITTFGWVDRRGRDG